MRMRFDGFAARLGLVTAAVLAVALVWQTLPLLRAQLVAWRAEPRPVAARGELAPLEQATIALFEQARDSVVFISTAERVIDPWSRDVFDVPRGTGSGFVWDELGHVVTNHHVVEGASRATVRLADDRSYRAQLVGTSPRHDLAVLRIGVGVGRPPPLPIGRSAQLRVGQSVFAIGNPFGLDWTLTTGVVSALKRRLQTGDGAIAGLVQTDAAINPGNSGGPLLDSAGRLVGVNTAIYSPSGASAGVGFAVPVDVVNRVVPQLIARGRYAPPSLGIETDPRADALARRLGVEGAMVVGVEPGSAADRLGLRPARIAPGGRLVPGDIIVEAGGRATPDGDTLRAVLADFEVGDRIELGLIRGGERRTVQATLGPASH
jgi:S1-C subfamily serine protease